MTPAEPEPLEGEDRAPGLSRRGGLIALALLAVHACLVFSAPGREGLGFDEPAHLIGGFAALQTGDYRLAVNANLAARWAALPLLARGAPQVAAEAGPAWARGEVYAVAFALLPRFEEGAEPVASGRRMIGLLSMLLAVLVFGAARHLHGEAGGLLALALYALSPTVIASARLVTADLAASLLLFAATWTTWRILERATFPRIATGSVVVALLFVTKPSAVAILPVAAVLLALALLRDGGPRPTLRSIGGGVLMHVLVAVFVAWSFFGFRAEATTDPAARAAWESELQRSFGSSGPLGRVLAGIDEAGLLPEAFLHTYAHVAQHGERPSYLLGSTSTTGHALFFPYLVLVKTPLGTMLAVLLAVFGARRAGWASAPFWTLLLVYGAMALGMGLNIGHRHLLPAYPALFVLAGGAAACFEHRRTLVRALPVIAVLLLAGESLAAWPHHLAFFNPLHGGRDAAWRHVADSSLDWGQDLPALAKWLDQRRQDGAKDRPFLSYFGTDDPRRRGIDAIELPSYHPWLYRHGPVPGGRLEPGLYVISATMYRGLYTRPLPPWTVEAEAEYRRLRSVVDPAFDPATPEKRVLFQDAGWRREYLMLSERRFVRLCRWLELHRPEPDAQPTPCYLAWSLSAEDLDAALFGPPPFESRP